VFPFRAISPLEIRAVQNGSLQSGRGNKISEADRRVKSSNPCVAEMRKHEWRIRSFYHKYLELQRRSPRIAHGFGRLLRPGMLTVLRQTGRQNLFRSEAAGKSFGSIRPERCAHGIMRDLTMLENQVPLFLLQKLLHMQLGLGSQEKAEEKLCNLVTLVCAELSPFMFKMPDSSRMRIKERGHILEAL
ncbi:hypothetical protein KI387_043625, partial [Taxus chinensis]